MSHPITTAPRRARSLALAAALVWALALLLPWALGGGRLEHALGGPASGQDPVVGLALVDDPTLQWTGVGRGVVELTYELTLTGAPRTTVALTEGATIRGRAATTRPAREITLTEGQPYRATLRMPVQCRNRVKVGVTATGPLVRQAEVFTWVESTKDTKGHLACTLI